MDYYILEFEHKSIGFTSVGIHELYGIRAETEPMTTWNLTEAMKINNIFLPKNYITIGDTMGGHMVIVMKLDSPNKHHIYLWDDQLPTIQAPHHIADSFTEFVEKLILEES